jgi:hypothetical protein
MSRAVTVSGGPSGLFPIEGLVNQNVDQLFLDRATIFRNLLDARLQHTNEAASDRTTFGIARLTSYKTSARNAVGSFWTARLYAFCGSGLALAAAAIPPVLLPTFGCSLQVHLVTMRESAPVGRWPRTPQVQANRTDHSSLAKPHLRIRLRTLMFCRRMPSIAKVRRLFLRTSKRKRLCSVPTRTRHLGFPLFQRLCPDFFANGWRLFPRELSPMCE